MKNFTILLLFMCTFLFTGNTANAYEKPDYGSGTCLCQIDPTAVQVTVEVPQMITCESVVDATIAVNYADCYRFSNAVLISDGVRPVESDLWRTFRNERVEKLLYSHRLLIETKSPVTPIAPPYLEYGLRC